MTWWAAYCEPRREAFARDQLSAAGFEVFYPFERVTRRVRARRDVRCNVYRLTTVDEPLFPRYLFVDAENAVGLRDVRGVIDVVRNCGAPVEVPVDVVGRLRAFTDLDGKLSVVDEARLRLGFPGREGDRFRFAVGTPLEGLVGRIASLARLDDTGVVRAFVVMLGAERLVDVSHRVVGPIVMAEAAAA